MILLRVDGLLAGRPAKPEINANLSPAWLAGAWAELGKRPLRPNIAESIL